MAWSALLVPTDFSEGAARAARLALRLVQPGGRLDLVHVCLPPLPTAAWSPWPGQPVPAIVTQDVPPARKQQARLDAWAAEAGLGEGRHLVRQGTPGPEIVKAARELQSDLIVMGARGVGPLERVLMGTTATSVVHDAPCDVLVVRGEPRMARILVGTDGSPNALHAAEDAAWMGERFGARILLAHVEERSLAGAVHHEGAETPGLAATNARVFQGRAELVHGKGNPAAVLRDVARRREVDLVAIGAHRGGLLDRILMGDTARALVHDAPCSVLVARIN